VFVDKPVVFVDNGVKVKKNLGALELERMGKKYNIKSKDIMPVFGEVKLVKQLQIKSKTPGLRPRRPNT